MQMAVIWIRTKEKNAFFIMCQTRNLKSPARWSQY